MSYTRRIVILVFTLALLSSCTAYRVNEPDYVSTNAFRINALLYTPRKMEPGVKYPGIVLNHSGTSGVDYYSKSWARELSARGYVVILPQFRGQGGSDGRVEYAHGEVDDAIAALTKLTDLEYVDRDRVAMVGTGIGGLVTIFALERNPEIKGAVLIAPWTDMTGYLDNTTGGRRIKRDPYQSEQHRKHIEEYSPAKRYGKINVPVLILQGERDKTAKPEATRKFCDDLKAAGKDVTLVTYPELDHRIMTYKAPMEEAIKFIEERLNTGGTKPGPDAVAAQ